jgi:hypothetical protein
VVDVDIAAAQNADDSSPPSYEKTASKQDRQASWFAIIGCVCLLLNCIWISGN